ncbi:hypothetical protein AMS68_003178 [Peltaster fructicola]|uniref:HTH APSES-type domain-containing protein n=1 Tax=Peltaster fructicola TaxID=286661 RepID=A0A6H0XSM4_9PEZI|nr:hypothetical protein AMS68_003178 [Peltaster fructicola]
MASGNVVSFPPYAILSSHRGPVPHDMIELAQHHDHFQVSLRDGISGRIEDTSRRIPYSSDKRDFLARTGRDAFEVYEYEFRLPEDRSKAHQVMWDYENGLVRITPFFKACHYSKTTPKKALEANGVLQSELSHSVTGGAVGAQGYWTPYACARALCITFCYPIRWALTPIFGPSFVQECLLPNDPGFGKFKIDSQLIEDAQAEAEEWRRAAVSYKTHASSTPQHTAQRRATDKKKLPKQIKIRKTTSRSTVESQVYGYGPDSPPVSPKTVPHKSQYNGRTDAWIPINRADDSAASDMSGTSPHSGTITPLSLPGPIIPPALLTDGLPQSSNHNKRKAKHEAQNTPTSFPAAVILEDDQGDSDDGDDRAIGDYIVRSPASVLSIPPPKRTKQNEHGSGHEDQHSAHKDVVAEAGLTKLNQAEMSAVSGLLKLVGNDRKCTLHLEHI